MSMVIVLAGAHRQPFIFSVTLRSDPHQQALRKHSANARFAGIAVTDILYFEYSKCSERR